MYNLFETRPQFYFGINLHNEGKKVKGFHNLTIITEE
uniref:Uncharacterized protein n=1 Tax=Arundo donax TaxID=35708 RepID=A0A0A9D6K5_ARUDO